MINLFIHIHYRLKKICYISVVPQSFLPNSKVVPARMICIIKRSSALYIHRKLNPLLQQQWKKMCTNLFEMKNFIFMYIKLKRMFFKLKIIFVSFFHSYGCFTNILINLWKKLIKTLITSNKNLFCISMK